MGPSVEGSQSAAEPPGPAAGDRRAIEVLPDHVIDQIAAGEVVERPASVVKELVENAIDAGASNVTVEVEAGGKRLIRVIDDGHGMTAAEAGKAVLRHATSKLRVLDDLVGIATMGFRGEALSSIASVSRLTLTTRARGEPGGALRLELEGGRIVGRDEVGGPPGTSLEVRDLLWNVPARQKFMKSEATEAAHLSEVVARLAMAHPRVGLRLVQRGKTTLDAPPCRSNQERVAALLGPRFGDELVRVDDGEAGVRVEAFLAGPEHSQTTARGLSLFVGRRAVRDRGLAHAVVQGYGELVPRGRYPVAVLFVDVAGERVDVNVHPQKAEVRFAEPQAVYAAVRHAVRRAVAQAPWLAAAAPAASVRMEVYAEAAPLASGLAADYARERARVAFGWARGARSGGEQTTLGGVGFRRVAPWPGAPSSAREPSRPQSPLRSPSPAPASSSSEGPGFFAGMRYLGQLDRTYLVCERAGELVLIDQHAGHERVAFQRLRQRHADAAVQRQRLLFPHTLEVGAAEAAALAELGEPLARVGYEVEPFGEVGGRHTLAVRSVPAGLRADDDPFAILTELVVDLTDGGSARALEDRIDHVFATIACHSVVRAGDTLSPAEVESLLAALDEVDFRAHCPHGRPLLLRMPLDEIARRFGRT